MQKQNRGAVASTNLWTRGLGLFLLALAVFLLAALLTYDPKVYYRAWKDQGVFFPFATSFGRFVDCGPAAARGPLRALFPNAGGALGLWFAATVLVGLGWVGVWVAPLGLGGWGLNRLHRRTLRPALLRGGALVPLLLAMVTAAAGLGGDLAGGRLGSGLWGGARSGLGPVGSVLLVFLAMAGGAVLAAEVWGGRWKRLLLAVARELRRGLGILLRAARWAARAVSRAAGRGLLEAGRRLRQYPWGSFFRVERRSETPPDARARATAGAAPPRIVDPDAAPEPAGPPPVPWPEALPVPTRVLRPRTEPAGHLDMATVVQEARRRAGQGQAVPAEGKGKALLPTAEILDDVPEIGPPVAEEELIENSRLLTETLRDFGVVGRVGEVHPGPVITRYEFVPGPGVRVAQILNRQDDLALKLRASRIRIIAPIPGKAAVGIEVPNRHPSPIFLRRLLETGAFREASGPLPLALGRDLGGAPMITELSRMPHLLLAGTTGSGKSVCMNALITSLLLKRTPEELRLLMIDPKMLELPMYNGIPHLLTEVVTDPKLAARTLKWLLLEMERRYRVLAARGCRNLQSYNSKVEREGPGEDGEGKLPYIVVLVDELADLMITSGKEVEEPIARLAQTARAVGIHLIVATQRPSVDVITGVIKANFPTRIAFQVASRTDSRTILDQNGAESLLGKGDMLFLPPGQAAPIRVHGAFVSESETQRLAEAWRQQGTPQALVDLEDVLAEPEGSGPALGDDVLFEDAARLVVAAGQASASLLQRRLKVGYARAARLVDMLEQAGVVSPPDGSKPREILVDEVRLEHVLAGDRE